MLAILLGLSSAALGDGTILLYHHVATNTPPTTSISPADFQLHLEYLRDNEFNVMPLDMMIESLKSGESIPDKSVAITFDDGYISIFEEAFPLLQSFGFPFALFLSTEPIDNEQAYYMNWGQIRDIANAGALIANHMIDHPYMLATREGESTMELVARHRQDLLFAEERILKETGQSHRYLAYPYGEFNPAIKQMLAEEGFVGLAQNSGAVGTNSDFLALPRYPLASIYADLDTARTKLDTLAFNTKIIEPLSPVTMNRSPAITLQFSAGNYNLPEIGCFANSRPIPMNWLDRGAGIVRLEPTEEYSGRRWRYICTAPAANNRYYWYSIQWIFPGE